MILLLASLTLAQDALPGEPLLAHHLHPLPPLAFDELGYAEDLAGRGLHEEAWRAFDRAAFELEGLEADRARYRAGEQLWALARPADDDFRLGAERALPEHTALFQLAEAESLYRVQRYGDAGFALQQIEAPELAELVVVRQAWIQVRQGKALEGAAILRSTPEGTLQAPAFEMADTIAAWEPLPLRKPALAGALSALLPGAGQLYAGEPRDALSALIVNGLLIGGTVEMARREMWVGTGAMGFLAVSFYSGNIFSAVNGARRRNQRLERARMDVLEARYELVFELDEEMGLESRLGDP